MAQDQEVAEVMEVRESTTVGNSQLPILGACLNHHDCPTLNAVRLDAGVVVRKSWCGRPWGAGR